MICLPVVRSIPRRREFMSWLKEKIESRSETTKAGWVTPRVVLVRARGWHLPDAIPLHSFVSAHRRIKSQRQSRTEWRFCHPIYFRRTRLNIRRDGKKRKDEKERFDKRREDANERWEKVFLWNLFFVISPRLVHLPLRNLLVVAVQMFVLVPVDPLHAIDAQKKLFRLIHFFSFVLLDEHEE